MPNKHIDGLSISGDFYDFLSFEILAGTGVGAHQFWTGFAKIVADFVPRLRALLAERARLQSEIDGYHKAQAGKPFDAAAYETHLRAIGYVAAVPAPFAIRTAKIDDVVAQVAAPQFIVPGSNPRFLTRAINARWSSLYDALYGSDLIAQDGGAERGQTYNKARGLRVIERGRDFLDAVLPLATGSHRAVTSYVISGGALIAAIENGEKVGLKDPGQLAAYQGRASAPTSILLRDKGLHIELKFDRRNPVGKEDRAGVADSILESAVTTIVDFEDTVVAVDIHDKINLYRNWLSVVKGSLRTQFKKNGRVTDRLFSADYRYNAPDGSASLLFDGRGLAMARVTGPQRVTHLVLDADERPIPEMFLDIAIAALAGVHDTRRMKPPRNSEAGSIYIIVPKLQGPDEAAFANDFLIAVEDVLDVTPNTVKLGLTDEECRTSLNLAACIEAMSGRIAWLGTSRLGRASSETGTAMESGPVSSESALLASAWMKAYEKSAVATALACGFGGRAQIATGAWNRLDHLAQLLPEKSEDLRAGMSVTCVPSPSAATLIAMTYHEVDVTQVRKDIETAINAGGARTGAADQFMPPTITSLPAEEIAASLDAHSYRVLAHIIASVNRGVGSVRILDAQGTLRLEDRSALRFSSLCVANWLKHGLVTRDDVVASLRRMAERVDEENKIYEAYKPMAPAFDGSAFNAAAEVMIDAHIAGGDFDEIIAARRREVKAGQAPERPNRFEFLKGATGRMESGEAFYRVSD